jgi:hypothetical protein
MGPFLASYFEDGSPPLAAETDDFRLNFAISPDAVNFTPLGRAMAKSGGPNGIARDFSILSPSKAGDGRWHLACTNHTFGTTIPNNSIDIYTGRTLDGISPTPQTFSCSAATDSGPVNWAWAPEWFTDSDGTEWFMVSTSPSGQSVDLASFSTWAYPATNAARTTFGAPVKMVGMPLGGIDCNVIKVGGTYYAFTKAGAMKMYTATSFPAGPWTLSAVNPVPDQTAVEAPNVLDMGGGVRRLYFDKYDDNGRTKYTESTDGFASFSNSTYVVCRDRMRHCSIIDLAPEPPLFALAAGGRAKAVVTP